MTDKMKTFLIALAGGIIGAIIVVAIVFGMMGNAKNDMQNKESEVSETQSEEMETDKQQDLKSETETTNKTDNENVNTQSGDKNETSKGTESNTEETSEAAADKTDTDKKANVKTEKGTPLANHGALSVKGTDLVDKNGSKYQLKGASSHGIAWYPDYVSYDSFKTLRDDWGANLVRIAMYTAESGGYCSGGDKTGLEKLVDKGVKAAKDLGMYVIIDWHILSDGNPNTYKSEAKTFFKKMSKKYKDYDNVLYEICNEPNGGTTWADIKSYADEVIPVIRANDKDAIIIVGTPTWSQDVEQVSSNPLKSENQKNVMYTAHFYAATHGDNIRDKVKKAIASETPVFISEFSICDASGNGGIDYDSAEKWYQLIREYNLSYAGWSLANKAETSAIIKQDCNKTSDWSVNELSDTGVWLRSKIKGVEASNDKNNTNSSTGESATKSNKSDEKTKQNENYTTKEEAGTYQFDVTIKNTSNSDISDWKITYKLPEGCSVVNGWCCDYDISGKILTIKALDWNKEIEKNASISGIGIQISSKKKLSDFTVKGDKYEAVFKLSGTW